MIRFIDVYKEYDNGTKALKGINLRIDDGEVVFNPGETDGQWIQPEQHQPPAGTSDAAYLGHYFSGFSSD